MEVVQVGLIAVPGPDVRDVGVGRIGDHILSQPESVHRDVPLPPRQHRPAGVFLHLQIRRGYVGRQRLEPQQPPAWVEDHRARLARPGVRGDELIAAGHGGRLRGHGDQRRMQGRTRVKALNFVRAAGMDRLGRGADRILSGDREPVDEPMARAARPQPRANRDALALGEGPRWQKARTVALRVGGQPSPVHARLRAGGAHAAQLARGNAKKADLGLR